MDHPVRSLVLLGAVHFARAIAVGEENPEAPAAGIGGKAPIPANHLSKHAAALLAEGLPKVETKKNDAAGAAAKPVANPEDAPANGIVRLPRYVVHEPRLPTPQEVMTRKELEHYAMDRYIGPEDGFDRGFLNVFTIAGLWKKIPILGGFPFVGSETNEDRGLRLYDEAERKRKMEEMAGLMSLMKESGDAAGAKKLKAETDKTFIRRADYGK